MNKLSSGDIDIFIAERIMGWQVNRKRRVYSDPDATFFSRMLDIPAFSMDERAAEVYLMKAKELGAKIEVQSERRGVITLYNAVCDFEGRVETSQRERKSLAVAEAVCASFGARWGIDSSSAASQPL